MRTPLARFGVVIGCMGVLAWSQAATAVSTVTVRAVKKNNGAITPTTTVSAVVGDTIEAEFFISGFAAELPNGARGYQFKVNGVAGSHGNCGDGLVLPVGWDRPAVDITCSTNNDCAATPSYPTCVAQGGGGVCVGPGHNAATGAFVTTSRPDFLNAGFTIFGGLNTTSLNYLYGFTNQENDGNGDFGVPYYAGTLKLHVKPGAGGTYTWGIIEGVDSFLTDPSPAGVTAPLHGVPLTINVPCSLPGIVSTDPPVCTIDARYPHDPNNALQFLGYDRLTLTLSRDPQQTLTCASNIVMSNVPSSPPFPTCQSIIQNGAQVTVVFSRPVPPERWVCVELHLTGDPGPSFDKACIGALPPDTDQSRLSETADTTALMDGLDGNPALQVWQRDIDRSTVFSPLDILASIDLLNGAGAFKIFRGTSLLTCPTVGIP